MVEAPRVWTAKSTMVVVPPNAAARVPVSKVSDDSVPPNERQLHVGVRIDPAREQQLPRRVDDPVRRDLETALETVPDQGHGLPLDENVCPVVVYRRDDASVLDQYAHPSLRLRGNGPVAVARAASLWHARSDGKAAASTLSGRNRNRVGYGLSRGRKPRRLSTRSSLDPSPRHWAGEVALAGGTSTHGYELADVGSSDGPAFAAVADHDPRTVDGNPRR